MNEVVVGKVVLVWVMMNQDVADAVGQELMLRLE